MILLLFAAVQSQPVRPSARPSVVDWRPLAHIVDSAIAAGAAPGGVVAVSVHGLRYIHAAGHLGIDDAASPDSKTLYDLASLTKVIGLTTGMMLAVSEGRIDLDAPVHRYVSQFSGPGKDAVTIRHLLTHSSGLPAHRRLWELATDRVGAIALVNSTPLDTAPGVRMLYSDLGAMVLTEALESAYGMRLDSLLAARIFGPLGMPSTQFLPPPSFLPRIAPTERDPWRGRILRGEVHDENAARLGGVSGHAGLFSDAEDLLRFGEWLLGDGQAGGRAGGQASPPISASVIREFLRRQELPPGSSRALGWDTPSENSSAGTRFSSQSFGHTGFTGTSIWMDPTRGVVLVLLTNRVHPTRDNNRHIALRKAVADATIGIIDAYESR
ncbi:MAG TPA: serine hydrolase domain-containing protein [Gemmatimonadales bacterium]|nr:serine hydrolase domain-containing protein [Gemmatimonadales bacterium]